MSDTNDTADSDMYVSFDGFASSEAPCVQVKADADAARRLQIWPGASGLYLSMSISQWQRLASAVDKAIADATAARLSAVSL